eukprot:g3684.t1
MRSCRCNHFLRRWASGSAAAAAGVAPPEVRLLHWVDACVISHTLCPFAAEVRARPSALRVRVLPPTADAGALLDAARSEIALLVHAADEDAAAVGGGAGGIVETTLLAVDSAGEPGGFLHSFSSFLEAAVGVERLCDDLTRDTACELQLAVFHPRARAELMEHSKPLAAMLAAAEEERGGSGGAGSSAGADAGASAGASAEHLHGADPADLAIRAPLPTFHLLRTRDVVAKAGGAGAVPALGIPERNRRKLRALAQRDELRDFEQCLLP